MGRVDEFRHSLVLKHQQAKKIKIKGYLPSVQILANLPMYEREWGGGGRSFAI